jgi:hypothetical protein
MKAVVLYFNQSSFPNLSLISEALCHGIKAQGIVCDCFNGEEMEMTSLRSYQYAAIGSVAESFFSKRMDEGIKEKMVQWGNFSGIKGFAFTVKKGLFRQKALIHLMENLEDHGMIVKNFEIFSGSEHAEITGKSLSIRQN